MERITAAMGMAIRAIIRAMSELDSWLAAGVGGIGRAGATAMAAAGGVAAGVEDGMAVGLGTVPSAAMAASASLAASITECGRLLHALARCEPGHGD